MSPLTVSLMVFACVFGGALLGIFLQSDFRGISEFLASFVDCINHTNTAIKTVPVIP